MSTPVAAQSTVHVDTSNPNCPGSGTVQDPFCRIQQGIQAALPGATVLVAPGTYFENLDYLGKAIEVRSVDGPRMTRIDGRGSGSVVRFTNGEGPSSKLSGFTITNGTGTWVSGSQLGGGVYCQGTSPTLSGLVFESNSARYGAGVCCYTTSSPVIENCRFRNGTAAVNGGGVFLWNDCDARMIGCTFTNNSCGHVGGAVAYRGGSAPYFANCIFHGNTAGDWGGGVRSGANSDGTFVHCTFYGNSAQYGGGLSAGSDTAGTIGTVDVVNSVFWANSASAGGPQLSLNGIFPTTVNVSFSDLEGGLAAVHVQPGFNSLNWQAGNIAVIPGFLDAAGGDFHLRATSPCLDVGNGTATSLPAGDFEGDPRHAGRTVDMGADEFHPHLYHSGNPSPGAVIVVSAIGAPGASVFLGASPAARTVPLSLPGLGGVLWLEGPIVAVPLGTVPATGALPVSLSLPPSMPLWTVPAQALVGLELTNLDVIPIRVTAPTITSITPAVAGPGTTVTVAGSDLLIGISVTVAGIPTPVISLTPTALTFQMPAGAGCDAVVGLTNVGSATVTEVMNETPAVTTVTHTSGPAAGGGPFALIGQALLGATATINGVPLVNIQTTETSLTGTTPAGSVGPAVVVVSNAVGCSTTVPYTYHAMPTISSITPPVAGPGTPVTIAGDNFLAGVSLTVGGIPTPITSFNATTLSFQMPPGIGCDAPVQVTNVGPLSASSTMNATPAINSAPITSGPAAGGTLFFVTGSNLSGATVTFHGVPMTNIVAQTAVSIVGYTPPGPVGPVTVSISNAIGCATRMTFTYL